MDKRIRGIGATSGLMVGAAKIREAYGLDAAGYEVIPGEAKDWIDNFKQAVSEQRWLVMPLWQPQWINAAYKVRVLDEPKGIYGKGDTAVLLGHESLKGKLTPETLERLRRIKLSVDAVTQMDLWVNVDGLTPREAARKWLAANPVAEALTKPANFWVGSTAEFAAPARRRRLPLHVELQLVVHFVLRQVQHNRTMLSIELGAIYPHVPSLPVRTLLRLLVVGKVRKRRSEAANAIGRISHRGVKTTVRLVDKEDDVVAGGFQRCPRGLSRDRMRLPVRHPGSGVSFSNW